MLSRGVGRARPSAPGIGFPGSGTRPEARSTPAADDRLARPWLKPDAGPRPAGGPLNQPTFLRDTPRSLWRILDDLWTDVRLALRTWRRNLGLAVVVTTILTVGIGISSTAVTIILDEYFRPSPRRPDSASYAYAQAYLKRTTTEKPGGDYGRFSLEDVEAIQRNSKAPTPFAGWRPVTGPLEDDVSAPVTGRLVTCNLFSVHGMVRPRVGRFLDQRLQRRRERECTRPARAPNMGAAGGRFLERM